MDFIKIEAIDQIEAIYQIEASIENYLSFRFLFSLLLWLPCSTFCQFVIFKGSNGIFLFNNDADKLGEDF